MKSLRSLTITTQQCLTHFGSKTTALITAESLAPLTTLGTTTSTTISLLASQPDVSFNTNAKKTKKRSSGKNYTNSNLPKKTSSVRSTDLGERKSRKETSPTSVITEEATVIDNNTYNSDCGGGSTTSSSDPPPLEAVFSGPFRFALRHFFVTESVPMSYYMSVSSGDVPTDSQIQTQMMTNASLKERNNNDNNINSSIPKTLLSNKVSTLSYPSPFERFPPAALAFASTDRLSPYLRRGSRGGHTTAGSKAAKHNSNNNNNDINMSASISAPFNLQSLATSESTIFNIKTQQDALSDGDVALIPVRLSSANECRVANDSDVNSAEVSAEERDVEERTNGSQSLYRSSPKKSKDGTTIVMRVPLTSIEKKFFTPSFSGRYMGLSSRLKARWQDALNVFCITRGILSKGRPISSSGAVQKRTVPTVEDYAACFYYFGRVYASDIYLWRLFCDDYSELILMSNNKRRLPSSGSVKDINNNMKDPNDIVSSVQVKAHQLQRMLNETRPYLRFVLPDVLNPLGGAYEYNKQRRDLSNFSIEYIVGIKEYPKINTGNDGDIIDGEVTDSIGNEKEDTSIRSRKSEEEGCDMIPQSPRDNNYDNSIVDNMEVTDSTTSIVVQTLGKELHNLSLEFPALMLSGDWLRALALCDDINRMIFDKFHNNNLDLKYFMTTHNKLIRRIGLSTLTTIANGRSWEAAVYIASTRIPYTVPMTSSNSNSSSSDMHSNVPVCLPNKDIDGENGDDKTVKVIRRCENSEIVDTMINISPHLSLDSSTTYTTITIPRTIMSKSLMSFTLSRSWVAGLLMAANRRSKEIKIDGPANMHATYKMLRSMQRVPEAWKVALRSVSDFLQQHEAIGLANKKLHASQMLFNAAADAAARRGGLIPSMSSTIINFKKWNTGGNEDSLSILKSMGTEKCVLKKTDDVKGNDLGVNTCTSSEKSKNDKALNQTLRHLYRRRVNFIYNDLSRRAMHLTLLASLLEQDMTYQEQHGESAFAGGRVLNRLAKTHPKYWPVVMPKKISASVIEKVFHPAIKLLKALPTTVPVPIINHSIISYARQQLTDNREGIVIMDTNVMAHLGAGFINYKKAIERQFGSRFGYEMEGIEKDVAIYMGGKTGVTGYGSMLNDGKEQCIKENTYQGTEIPYLLEKVMVQTDSRKVLKAKTFKFILPQSTLIELSNVAYFNSSRRTAMEESHTDDQRYSATTTEEQPTTTISVSAKTNQTKLFHFFKLHRSEIQAFEPSTDFMASVFSPIAALHGFESLGSIDRHIGNIALAIDMGQRSVDGSGRYSSGIGDDQSSAISVDFATNVQPPDDSGIAFGSFFNSSSDTIIESQNEANETRGRMVMMKSTPQHEPPAIFTVSTTATGITSTTLAEKLELGGPIRDHEEMNTHDTNSRQMGVQDTHVCKIPGVKTSYLAYQARRALGICKAPPSNNVVVFTFDNELRSYMRKAGIAVYPNDENNAVMTSVNANPTGMDSEIM